MVFWVYIMFLAVKLHRGMVKAVEIFKALTLVFFMVIFSKSHAATIEPMTLSEIVLNSETIVVGRCSDVRSVWKNNKIITEATYEIIDTVKGDVSDSIVMFSYGGVAEHPVLKTQVQMSVSGAAAFELGKKSILLSDKSISGKNQLVGMSQGKFDIEVNEETGEELIAVGRKKWVKQEESNAGSVEQWLYFSTNADFHHHDEMSIVEENIPAQELLDMIRQHVGEQ